MPSRPGGGWLGAPALASSSMGTTLGGTLLGPALGSALGGGAMLPDDAPCLGGGGIFGLNWGEMFIVGSVLQSPASVTAGDVGAGSVGTS